MTTSQPTPPRDKTYSPKEVSEILGVHIYTVRRWLRDETINGVKIGEGKHWRVTQSELNRILQERIG